MAVLLMMFSVCGKDNKTQQMPCKAGSNPQGNHRKQARRQTHATQSAAQGTDNTAYRITFHYNPTKKIKNQEVFQ